VDKIGMDGADNPHRVITTLGQFRAYGFAITAHWRCGHSRQLDLGELIARHGADAEPDYRFKAALVCPECGTVGAGIAIAEER
jgi:hypothetical protein